jgi:hypothetical protein
MQHVYVIKSSRNTKAGVHVAAVIEYRCPTRTTGMVEKRHVIRRAEVMHEFIASSGFLLLYICVRACSLYVHSSEICGSDDGTPEDEPINVTIPPRLQITRHRSRTPFFIEFFNRASMR